MQSGSAQEATAAEAMKQGFNSVKDFLLSRTNTTAIDSQTFSPSQKKGLNFDSSGHISGLVNRSNVKGRHSRRPRTGVASKGRNSTNIFR